MYTGDGELYNVLDTRQSFTLYLAKGLILEQTAKKTDLTSLRIRRLDEDKEQVFCRR